MPPNAKRQKQKPVPKIALVLGGGAVKAATFHLGVLMALERKGFAIRGTPAASSSPYTISTLVGSSSGALIGAMASGGHPMQALVRSQLMTNPRMPKLSYSDLFHVQGGSRLPLKSPMLGWVSFAKRLIQRLYSKGASMQGLFSSWGLSLYLRKYFHLAHTFGELPVELFLVGSNIYQNRGYIFGPTSYFSKMDRVSFCSSLSVAEAVAGSTALPGIYQPFRCKIEGQSAEIMDGEIFFACPLEVALATDADLIILSHIYRPFLPKHHHIPKFTWDEITLLGFYAVIYNHLYARLRALNYQQAPRIVVIEPPASENTFHGISHFSLASKSITMGMYTGYHAAISAVPLIHRYIQHLPK